MISQRILNLFKEHTTSPQYRVEILDIKNNELSCGQESITLTVKQIYGNGNSIQRDLIIYSDFNIDFDGSYISVLNGYIGNETYSETNTEKQSSHYIEVVNTILQKTVDITFNQPYENQPFYYVINDKKYESLYKDTSVTYIQNEEELYSGMQIVFNHLKTRQSYPEIGILIIGDEKGEDNTSQGILTIAPYELDEDSKIKYISGVNISVQDKNKNEIFNKTTDASGGVNVTLDYSQEYFILTEKENYIPTESAITFSKENSMFSILLEKAPSNEGNTEEEGENDNSG